MIAEQTDRYRHKKCYNIRGSYYNGVYDGRENIENYCGGNIEVGEYLCWSYGSFGCMFNNQWVSSIVVKQLLNKNLLKKSDIIKQHRSNKIFSTEKFVEFSKWLYSSFSKESAKKLFCQWYGTFNSMVSRSDIGLMTTDREEVAALYNKNGIKLIKYTESSPGIFTVSKKMTEKHHYNHSWIYNAIIGIGQNFNY